MNFKNPPPKEAKPRTVRIFLKAPTHIRFQPEGERFKPVSRLSTKCSCNATLLFYTTYPNEKSMPFDREPTILDEVVLGNGAVIATVSANDTHFNSCRDLLAQRKQERPTHGFNNFSGRR